MLIIAHSLRELDFRRLMEIYEEGNLENGAECFPNEHPLQQLLLAEQDFYQYLRECFFPTPGAVYCVLQEEGSYCSALRLEPYRDGLLLEALETAPRLRRRGYAERLIREVSGRLSQPVYSHISKKNTASLRTHEKCGFVRILDHAVYADGSVSFGAYTYCK